MDIITKLPSRHTGLFVIGLAFLLAACTETQKPIGSVDPVAQTHIEQILLHWQQGELDAAQEDWAALTGLLNGDEASAKRLLTKELDEDESEQLISDLASDQEILALVPDIQETGAAQDTQVQAPIPANPAVLPTGISKTWLKNELREILQELGAKGKIHIPNTMYRSVQTYLVRFTNPAQSRKFMETSLQRMDKYRPMVSGIFEEKRLPSVLHYLALIESGYNPNARSHVGAVGMWQFIRSTGRNYGLNISRRTDDRKDPRKSTIAAREYLLDLILDFGSGDSVLLAMAAYNAGEGRIRSRLRRLDDYHDRSFWTLVERDLLPTETSRYIPQILAAAVIGRNRGKFGFDADLPGEKNRYIVLHRPISIPHILETSHWDQGLFLALNPDLKGRTTTPKGASYHLVVPLHVAQHLETDKSFQLALKPPSSATLTASRSSKEKTATTPSTARQNTKKAKPTRAILVYRVQRGNSWQDIADWSGVSVKELRRQNPKTSRRGLKAGQPLYIRGVDSRIERLNYMVQRGDTLSEIAEIHAVSVKHLKIWNGLRSTRLAINQHLTIYTGESIHALKKTISSAKKKPKTKTTPRRKTRFTVQSGNTLSTIAKAFDVSVSALKKINRLKSNRIHSGQKLRIPGRLWTQKKYRVKRGDILASIAKQYRTTTRALMTFNGLRSGRIYTGEVLLIYQKS